MFTPNKEYNRIILAILQGGGQLYAVADILLEDAKKRKAGTLPVVGLALQAAYDAGVIDICVKSNREWEITPVESWFTARGTTSAAYLAAAKTRKYNMRTVPNSDTDNTIKCRYISYTNNSAKRAGFMYAGSVPFRYDIAALKQHSAEIAEEIYKGVVSEKDKHLKDCSYEDIVSNVVDATKDSLYTLGRNKSDSRGRSIFACTSKVLNPIGHKSARALIRLPKAVALTDDGMNHVYAFVAELNGEKCLGQTFLDKVAKGKQLYADKYINTNAELHERIWLERIYSNLDRYDGTNWNVAIEIDASSSMLQIMGALTNNHNYLKATNVIGDTYSDAYHVEGLPRKHVKIAMIPRLYGSSAEFTKLWDNEGLKYTKAYTNIMEEALTNGFYKAADTFKDYIIKSSKVHPAEFPSLYSKRIVQIFNEKLALVCNKVQEDMFASFNVPLFCGYNKFGKAETKMYTFSRAVYPNTSGMERVFVTLLIHNLDSQIANAVCLKMSNYKDVVIVPVHDAFITDPNYCTVIKETYRDELFKIYKNRKEILSKYAETNRYVWKLPESCNVEIQEFSTNCLK